MCISCSVFETGENQYVDRPTKGYDNIDERKSNELLIETLKMKQFYVDEYHKPDVILDSSLVELITKNIKLMYDFVKFLHNALM